MSNRQCNNLQKKMNLIVRKSEPRPVLQQLHSSGSVEMSRSQTTSMPVVVFDPLWHICELISKYSGQIYSIRVNRNGRAGNHTYRFLISVADRSGNVVWRILFQSL